MPARAGAQLEALCYEGSRDVVAEPGDAAVDADFPHCTSRVSATPLEEGEAAQGLEVNLEVR